MGWFHSVSLPDVAQSGCAKFNQQLVGKVQEGMLNLCRHEKSKMLTVGT